MMPVCSATTSCSSHTQVSIHGGLQPFSPFRKESEVGIITHDGRSLGLPFPTGTHFRSDFCKTRAIKPLYSEFIKSSDKSFSTDLIDSYSFQNESISFESNVDSGSIGTVNEQWTMLGRELKYVDNSLEPAAEEGLMDASGQSTASTDVQLVPLKSKTISMSDIAPENSLSASESIDVNNDSLSSMKTSMEDFLAGVNKSFSTSLDNGESAVKNSVDTITSSLSTVIKRANEALDSAINGVFSTTDKTGELAGNRLTSFSTDLKEGTSKASVIAVEALRRTIIAVEDSLSNVTSFIVYSYGSAKELLAPEIKNALSLSEEKAIEILRPVSAGFEQAYSNIEDLEKSLGLDPNDPLIQFVLLLGTSATLWVFYWVWSYSGYSGDLSPQTTLELLTGTDDAVLIDVRPEVLREKVGIPDLRRRARFRYASVNLPEVDGSVSKLLKSRRDLDDTLIAAVIRNLKIVQDRSKVIVMDADGTRSKSIARSLKKLGVKKPYLIQGGFQSWMKQGLRIKELKPETTLTILNEEAEAILEDISPSPVQVLGYGLGFVAASYALLEWEKTLQLIGIIGLGQTIYRRIATYEDSEDFRRDLRLLLTPVRVGGQALSWAASELETNGMGLPTSPSSSDVQNRVLQAAAKHESQPSDIEGIQDRSSSSSEKQMPASENIDLSEA